jgi:hypothetical protein
MVIPKLVAVAVKRFPDLKADPSKAGSWLTTPRSRHRDAVPLIA